MPIRPQSIPLELDAQRRLGISLFNYAWTLLEKEDRTEPQTERMINAAHASRLFWEDAGEPVNWARGEWQISRVYAAAGMAEPALLHAGRCLRICQEHGIGDFDLAYAYEALARAAALAADGPAGDRYLEQAREAADQIGDPEDRKLVLADLASLEPTV